MNTFLGFALLVVSWRSTAFKGHHFWHITVATLVMGVAILNSCNLNIKNTEIKKLEYQITESGKKLDSLITDNASLESGQGSLNKQHIESQTRIDELKDLLQMKDQRIIELEKLLPRKLSNFQKNILLSYLQNTNIKLMISTVSPDAEALDFAEQIGNTIAQIGCEVTLLERVVAGAKPGLEILYNNVNQADADKLYTALSVIGLNPRYQFIQDDSANEIWLYIGPKPVK